MPIHKKLAIDLLSRIRKKGPKVLIGSNRMLVFNYEDTVIRVVDAGLKIIRYKRISYSWYPNYC